MINNNKNTHLIYIPKEANYIEILGHRIDGFDSFEAFCEHLKKYAELEEMVGSLQEENESLQRQLHNVKLHQKETHKALQDEKVLRLNEDFIKAEAYKEFADRLKEDLKNSTLWGLVSFDRIDNFLKELVGEDNA